MKIVSHERIPDNPVTMEGAVGCTVRWLVGKADQAPNFAMREFTVEPGGHTPRHSHPYEHEVFVLEGDGVVVEGIVQHRMHAGDVVYVAPNEVHQFKNTSQRTLRFLCIVPNSSYGLPVRLAAECGEPARGTGACEHKC